MQKTFGLLVRIALLCTVLASFLCLAFYVLFDQIRHSAGPHTKDAYFYVAPAIQPPQLASELSARGLILNARYYGWLQNWHKLFFTADYMPKAGEYIIPAGASLDEIRAIFHSGIPVQRRITFPEGLTSTQMLARIDNATGLFGDLAGGVIEGDLFPDTYFYTYGMKKQQIIDRMLAKMEIELAQAWAERAAGLPYKTPKDALIMASIIEKETGRVSERRLVASVFVNRLNKGMRLQSDPTVIYGVGAANKAGYVLTKSDLATQNPYNTYRIFGLPSGPITNPGRAALRAALNPVASAYFYFVADGKGGHWFAKTLDEHNKNTRKYRNAN